MNGKASKKLRKLAKLMGEGRSPEDIKSIYKRLKSVHQEHKKAPKH